MNQFIGGIRIHRWVPVFPHNNTDRAIYSCIHYFILSCDGTVKLLLFSQVKKQYLYYLEMQFIH